MLRRLHEVPQPRRGGGGVAGAGAGAAAAAAQRAGRGEAARSQEDAGHGGRGRGARGQGQLLLQEQAALSGTIQLGQMKSLIIEEKTIISIRLLPMNIHHKCAMSRYCPVLCPHN